MNAILLFVLLCVLVIFPQREPHRLLVNKWSVMWAYIMFYKHIPNIKKLSCCLWVCLSLLSKLSMILVEYVFFSLWVDSCFLDVKHTLFCLCLSCTTKISRDDLHELKTSRHNNTGLMTCLRYLIFHLFVTVRRVGLFFGQPLSQSKIPGLIWSSLFCNL